MVASTPASSPPKARLLRERYSDEYALFSLPVRGFGVGRLSHCLDEHLKK